MPQGSWLGPLSFLVLIDDLTAGCPTVKYDDDTTLSETFQPKSYNSSMAVFLDNILAWSLENNMELNTSKTKEMVLGPIARSELAPHLLTTPAGTIERVHSFKLLGVHIESSLCWSTDINSILKIVTQRMYFLKQLKRAGLSSTHLLEYCIAVIRPVLECCVPVWHHALTKEQSKQIEAIQKRAIHIILNFTRGMPYTSMLYAASINILASRRHDIYVKDFSVALLNPLPAFITYVPAPREQSLTARFRSVQKYPRVYARTSRYCSFINYSLNNYQDKITNPI